MKSKIKTIFISFGIIFFLLTLFFEVFAVPPKPRRLPPKKRPVIKRRFIPAPPLRKPLRPGPKYLWIQRYRFPSGAYVGGFWRPPCGKGFTWVDGHWDEEGEWIFGFCKPVNVREGYVWVPGYWDGTKWIEGHWRLVKKPGFIWVPGHFNDSGIWIKGHWKVL